MSRAARRRRLGDVSTAKPKQKPTRAAPTKPRAARPQRGPGARGAIAPSTPAAASERDARRRNAERGEARNAAQETKPAKLRIEWPAKPTPRERLAGIVAGAIVGGDLGFARYALNDGASPENIAHDAAVAMRRLAGSRTELVPAARVLEAVWLALRTHTLAELRAPDAWACELLKESTPVHATADDRPRMTSTRLPGPRLADVGRVLLSEVEKWCGEGLIAQARAKRNALNPDSLARVVAFRLPLIIKQYASEATGALEQSTIDAARPKIEAAWLAAWQRGNPLTARELARLGLRACGLTSDQAGKPFNAATKNRTRRASRAR